MLLLTGTTKTLKLPQPIPVYIVYMTAEPAGDAQDVILLKDIYGQNQGLLAAR
jgi:murein L,D-transpeptidase YcbB/YkuD